MNKQMEKLSFRADTKLKKKLSLIAQDKGVKPSVVIRRVLEDYVRLYEERGY